MARHNELGRSGELAASEFLISKGYIVRDMNWRVGKLEIDIVAQELASNLLHVLLLTSKRVNLK